MGEQDSPAVGGSLTGTLHTALAFNCQYKNQALKKFTRSLMRTCQPLLDAGLFSGGRKDACSLKSLFCPGEKVQGVGGT